MTEQAKKRPRAIAVSQGQQRLSYAALDAASNRLAGILLDQGAGPGRIVALLAPRSVHLIVTLLAILKTGAAYLALDGDSPTRHLTQQCTDASPVLAVVSAELRERMPEVTTPVTVLQSLLAETSCQPLGDSRSTPEGLAYVSYTSGSTGEPKGVCVPHRAVARLVRQPSWATFGSDDVFLQLAPIAFDASTLEIWAALANGGRLAVHPPGPLSPDSLAQTLADERVTVLALTTGLFHQMVDTQLAAFGGLRHVITGGEVLSRSHLEKLLHAHPRLTFTNGYGPTENTTFSTCWTTTGQLPEGPVPIGRPVSGTGVVILDHDREPGSPQDEGELCVFGAGLADGYLNRPGATAERFITVPGPQGRPVRLYRTGDLVRWRADGSLEFAGRLDQQVKIQGYRVEPGAVEAVLIEHPMVRDAVVVPEDDGAGGKRLIAYVACDLSSQEMPAAEISMALRQQAQARLPRYMIPYAVKVLASLPLGPTGKVDRDALPEVTRHPRESTVSFRSPRTELEAWLAGVWTALLNVEPVGIDDNFFELGGHSMLMAEVIRRVEQRTGIRLSYLSLLEQPTIAGLAVGLAAGLTGRPDAARSSAASGTAAEPGEPQ